MSYIGRGLETGSMRQLDDISSSFDGSTTGFTMQINSVNVDQSVVGDVNQLVLSLGGVVQNPGTDFTVSGSTLTFTTAPASGLSFFCIIYGGGGGFATPGDKTVTEAKFNILDGKSIKFGTDDEVELTHNADKGLILKHTATADDKPVILTLQTGETDMAASDVMGKIEFQAPDEGTGTDAILVAAAIQAVSEGDFSSSSNATSLQFMTGSSEAAAAKMYVKSNGNVSIGTANPIMSGYDANSTKLTVYDGSGSAQSGYLELGANASTNGYNAGAITFVNENNADATNNDADGKIVSMVRSTIVTSDSNAGDDSGAAIELWTKAEAGSLTKRWQVLSDGNLLPNATSTGVYLGVTSATPANLLDDYEEGTFAPTIVDGDSDVTSIALNGSYDTLAYTKIGNVVHIQGHLVIASYSGTWSNGVAILGNLPFTSADLTDAAGRGIMGMSTYNTVFSSGEAPYLWISEGATTCYAYTSTDNGASGRCEPSTSAQWYIAGSYMAA